MASPTFRFTPGPSFVVPEELTADGLVRAGTAESLRVQSFYFDTPDLRLARWGVAVRYGNDTGWTVELPLDGSTHHVESVAGGPGDPPPRAVELVCAFTRTAPLGLVVRLTTLRQRLPLHASDGEELGALVDDEVSVLDGMRLAARFRELTVSIAGPKHVRRALLGRLRLAGAGEPDETPSLVRALGPSARTPSDVPDVELGPWPDASEVLRAEIARSTRRLVRHDPGVRLGHDPEDVHQARVATRRLRAALQTFGPVIERSWRDHLRGELGWLADQLGAVRDPDVLSDRLHTRLETLDPADGEPGRRLLEELAQGREPARARLLDALRSSRYLQLLDALVEASGRIPAPTHRRADGSGTEEWHVGNVASPAPLISSGPPAYLHSPVLGALSPDAASAGPGGDDLPFGDPASPLRASAYATTPAARRFLETDVSSGDPAPPAEPSAAGDRDRPPPGEPLDPGDTRVEVEMAELLHAPWRRLRHAVRTFEEDPSDESLHDIRIGAKRVRYSAEALTPALGPAARRLAKAAAELSEVLGEHQDASVAQTWLRAHGATHDDPGVAFVAGQLSAQEARSALTARDQWRKAWGKVQRAHRRSM